MTDTLIRSDVETEVLWLSPSGITALEACQPRLENQQDVIREYAELMANGTEFPPVKVRYDGTRYYLTDGFHRRSAAILAGLNLIAAEVQTGDQVDAIEDSCAANTTNGLHRAPGDKRRAVERMFEVERLRGVSKSDYKIAAHCGVSQPYVHKLRGLSNHLLLDRPQREVTRNGTTYVMDTERIGARPNFGPVIEAYPQPETWQRLQSPLVEPQPTIAEVVSRMDQATTNVIVESERQSGVRLVVGETVADCNKHLSQARNELGVLMNDLGLDQIRAELSADGYMRQRWERLAEVADSISNLARSIAEEAAA